jgi:hypothetical protein
MNFLIAYASPIQAIVGQLAGAIANSALPNTNISSIPVRAVRTELGQLYASPVGLQLAAISKVPADEISQHLIECLPSRLAESQTSEHSLWDFQIWADDSGWIYARLSDPCMAAWLQQLSQSSPQRLPGDGNKSSIQPLQVTADAVFSLQYAHARCCSLIQLAHREKLLHLQHPDPPHSPQFWQVSQPQPFPWLTPAGQLCCQHPSEQVLISQLFEFPGLGQRSLHGTHAQNQEMPVISLNCSEDQLLRQAETWSDRILQFHRDCRIWGEVKTENPNLSRSRLGLLIATQSIVQFYLHDILAVHAPLEF